MEDAPDLVSILDADILDSRRELVRRADCLRTCDLPTWRRPNANVPEVDHGGWFVYRSMIAWPLATRVRLPIRRLLEAFVWHTLRGDIPSVLEYPGKGRIPYFGTRWPGYGFDEWFLSVALYPRLAARGMLTDVSATSPGYAFPLDLEYAAWANPLSETASPVRMVEPAHSGSHSARRRMLQFGTSGNVLEGWENFDWPEVDITRPLPFPDACARFMFLEHVIEHVTAREAWDFFAECRRVLEPGGILRLAFPDMVQIIRSAAPCYHEFI